MYKLFEERVLTGTSQYYSKDGETVLQKFYVEQKSFVEYMKYIKNRLNDEIKRTKMLHHSTEAPLMELCYKILIEKHLEIFDAEFRVRTSLILQFQLIFFCLCKMCRSITHKKIIDSFC